MGNIGRNNKGHSGLKPMGFAIHGQFQYTFMHLYDLLVWVGMHRHRSTCGDFPHDYGHVFRVNKAPFITWEEFLLWKV